MAETISGTVASSSQFVVTNTAPLSTTLSGSPVKGFTRVFTSTDITKCYFNTYTITTTPTTIDVTSLTDAFNNSISFTTVKNVLVVNNDTTNALAIGGGTNALFGLMPQLVGQSPASGSAGSCLNLTTNITTSGTQKIISMVSTAGSISVDLFIVGS